MRHITRRAFDGMRARQTPAAVRSAIKWRHRSSSVQGLARCRLAELADEATRHESLSGMQTDTAG